VQLFSERRSSIDDIAFHKSLTVRALRSAAAAQAKALTINDLRNAI